MENNFNLPEFESFLNSETTPSIKTLQAYRTSINSSLE